MLNKVEDGPWFPGQPGMECEWGISKQKLREKKNIQGIRRQKGFKKLALRKGLKKTCPKEIRML